MRIMCRGDYGAGWQNASVFRHRLTSGQTAFFIASMKSRA